MLKVLSVPQIRDLDAYTIANEPIASIDLMERASEAFCEWYISHYESDKTIAIIGGPGNNGGDGLAIARILQSKNYSVQVFIFQESSRRSDDFTTNLNRLDSNGVEVIDQGGFKSKLNQEIIIDAIFGSGLSRPLKGIYQEVVEDVNSLNKTVISVDIPSGLYADETNNKEDTIIRAKHTVAFQLPKLSFLLPQNHMFIGDWHLVDIGLNQSYIDDSDGKNYLLQKADIKAVVKKRSKFDHKGTNGKGLIISGSYGKMGAAVLATKAALKSGIGLLTVYVPKCGYTIMQTSIPEAMTLTDDHDFHLTAIPSTSQYDVVGIGPGLGRAGQTVEALSELIRNSEKPMVLDADALNILSMDHSLLETLPENSILTPHPKEFERLVGNWDNDFERLDKQKSFSARYGCIVVLKGAHTSISTPEGEVYFNSTGNPGMATAGSGDVLLGIITAFLAQKYSPTQSAILGVYLHGLAGDLAVCEQGEYSLIASDIIVYLPRAIMSFA